MAMIQVDELLISTRVMDKLWRQHHVLPSECMEAFTEDPEGLAVWSTDKTRTYGRRLKIIGTTASGRALLGYLYPTDDPTVWRVSTAWEPR